MVEAPAVATPSDQCCSIGNTGNSLQRVLSLALGIIAVAGLSYAVSMATVVGSSLPAERKKAEVDNLTTLAAIAFLLTVIAAHFIFQPGAEMITSAYQDKDGSLSSDGQRVLANFEALSGAMSLYWGTIFSLALASAYFPAVFYIDSSATGSASLTGLRDAFLKIVKVLAPLIGGGILELGAAFFE
jgi:hypothetical protein